jgi:small subunit ribosomal protein S24e
MANVAKSSIKAKLATTFKTKEENISVYGLKTKFGGGRSTGFALIYDNVDFKKKYDLKTLLRRVCSINDLFINIYKDGHMGKNAKTRKQKKEIKGRVKRVRGVAKAKAAMSGGAKKK